MGHPVEREEDRGWLSGKLSESQTLDFSRGSSRLRGEALLRSCPRDHPDHPMIGEQPAVGSEAEAWSHRPGQAAQPPPQARRQPQQPPSRQAASAWARRQAAQPPPQARRLGPGLRLGRLGEAAKAASAAAAAGQAAAPPQARRQPQQPGGPIRPRRRQQPQQPPSRQALTTVAATTTSRPPRGPIRPRRPWLDRVPMRSSIGDHLRGGPEAGSGGRRPRWPTASSSSTRTTWPEPERTPLFRNIPDSL